MDGVDIVTTAHVRDLLRRMYHDRTPGPTPLDRLAFVRRSLERQGFAATAPARAYELGRLMIQTVEDELAVWRGRCGVASDAADPHAQLVADFAPGHRELEAWSAVYHLFLRPDLDYTLQDVVALLHDRHRRTLQRRLARGVAALAARLTALERAAVLEARRERLAARLPPAPVRLVGARDLIDSVARAVADRSAPRPIALAGPGGIGKTALARCLAEHCLQASVVDHVAWISLDDVARVAGEGHGTFEGRVKHAPGRHLAEAAAPAAAPVAGDRWHAVEGMADRLLDALARALGPEPNDATPDALAQALRRARCLVVVDALDEPETAAAAVAAFRPFAPLAPVVLTGRVGWSRCADIRVVGVSPLRAADALALARAEALARGLGAVAAADAATLDPLIAATGGHPLAIRRAVGELRIADVATVTADFAHGRGAAAALLAELWEPVWRAAAPDVRTVVVAVAGGRAADGPAPSVCEAVDRGLLVPDRWAVGGLRTALLLRRYLAGAGVLRASGAGGRAVTDGARPTS